MAFADLAGYLTADKQFVAVLKNYQADIAEQTSREKACANRIISMLKKGTDGIGIDIDRYITAGSIGFHIRGGNKFMYRADFDLYVYFNLSDTSNARIQESIPKILSSVCNVINKNSWMYSICRGDPEAGSISVEEKPSIGTGYRNVVNVFTAVNFGRSQAQWKELLKRNAEDWQSQNYLRWSHMERTAQYLEEQTNFVRNVVSLAKCWNERTFIVEPLLPFLRQSFIVELVAVKAAQDESREMKDRKTMSAALERFFNLLGAADMGDVCIVLDKLDGDLPDGWEEKYESRKTESRVLIDPTNPFVNYFDDAEVQANWHNLQNKAFSSLKLWAEVEKGVYTAGHLIGLGTFTEESCNVM